MNEYLKSLLNTGVDNNCTIIKNLINIGILSHNLVIRSAIETNNARIIYEIAKNIAKKDDIPRLENAICQTENAMYIYFFAKDIEDISINKFVDAICKTKEKKYILDFILNIGNIDISSQIRLIDSLICLNATEELNKVLNNNVIDENNILKKIKYYIHRSEDLQIQFNKCKSAAADGLIEELKLYAPLYRKLLGNETYNLKRRVLSKEKSKFSSKRIGFLKPRNQYKSEPE